MSSATHLSHSNDFRASSIGPSGSAASGRYTTGTTMPRQVGLLPVDGWLLGIVVALIVIGLIFVASASTHVGMEHGGSEWHYISRQVVFLFLAIVAGSVVFAVPVKWWNRGRFLALGLGYLLLIGVLIFGKEVNHATRWIAVGPINIQGSEVARVCFILYMAGFLAHQSERVRTELGAFIPPVLLFLLAAVLLLEQPDFGATVVLGATMMGMLFLAGARLLPFLLSFLLAAGSAVLLVIYSPYRWQRLTGSYDPWSDAYGAGYQLVQALIAIGRGEWSGVGIGQSLQKQGYLPEAHTDFIYAVIGEELGLWGTFGVLALFALLVWRIFVIASTAINAGRQFSAYLCAGIGLWLGMQAFVNIGVNMGVLPTKGLTLPMVSYGGSSLVVTVCALAMILKVSYELRAGKDGMQGDTPNQADTFKQDGSSHASRKRSGSARK